MLAFFSFQFAFASGCPTFKNNELKFCMQKMQPLSIFCCQELSAASPSFPYFHRFDFHPKKPKVPTVTRDIIYGWARGLVGPLLLDCFAPSTFTHKAGGMEIFFWKTSFLLVCGRSLIGIAGGFFQTSQTDSETQRTLGRLLVFCVFFVLKYFDFQGRMLRFCLEDFFYETLFQEFCCHILVGEVGWFSV